MTNDVAISVAYATAWNCTINETAVVKRGSVVSAFVRGTVTQFYRGQTIFSLPYKMWANSQGDYDTGLVAYQGSENNVEDGICLRWVYDPDYATVTISSIPTTSSLWFSFYMVYISQ